MTDPRGAASPAGGNQRLVAALVVALALVTGFVLGVAAVDRGFLLRRPGPPGGREIFIGRGGPRRGPPALRRPGPPGGREFFIGRGGPRRGPPERMRQRFATELGLNPAQMTQIDSIMSREMVQRRALADSMDARMHVLMDSTRAAVDRVLDAEQRQKLASLRAHRDSMRGPGRGRGFPPGPPP